MSTGTIFFSYSRDDSEFVLELAKTLRNAGATVWLDQLDIKPGSRWDRSIETALEKSNTLLVILSKSSVSSQNVLDEVSYALEENKKVVPVLLESCDIPFRLRRLQFADFSQDKDKGIQTLIAALDLERDVAVKLKDTHTHALEDAPAHKPRPSEPVKVNTPSASKKETPPPVTKPTGSSKSFPKIAIAIAAAVVVAALVWAFYPTDNSDPERMAQDQPEEVLSADDKNWLAIQDQENPQLFQNHLETYENCTHQDAAWAMIEKDTIPEISEPAEPVSDNPVASEEESDDYKFAKRTATPRAYIHYLEKYGQEAFYAEESIAVLDSLLSSSGFTYYGDTHDRNYEVILNQKEIPEVGDYIKAKRDYNIKAGVWGESGFNRRLGTVKKDAILKVEERIPSGSNFWLKVNYQ